MSRAPAGRLGAAASAASTSRASRPARERLRLQREVDAAQVAGTDLVRPAGYLPVEGGGAAQRDGDGRPLAQRDLGAQRIPIGAVGHEPDAGDVLERDAQATAAEVALERRAAAAAHVIRRHLLAVYVGEGGVKVAHRRARAAASAQRSHPQQRRRQPADAGRARGAPPNPAHAFPPAPDQLAFQVVPPGPSSSTMPCSPSRARMASASLKLRRLRAALRSAMAASISASLSPALSRPLARRSSSRVAGSDVMIPTAAPTWASSARMAPASAWSPASRARLRSRTRSKTRPTAFAALRSSSMASQKAVSKGVVWPARAPSTPAGGRAAPAASSARARVSYKRTSARRA